MKLTKENEKKKLEVNNKITDELEEIENNNLNSKNKNNINNKKGITLIVLVMTIILLTVITSITMAKFTTKDQGIIDKSQKARDDFKDADEKETQGMKEIHDYSGWALNRHVTE